MPDSKPLSARGKKPARVRGANPKTITTDKRESAASGVLVPEGDASAHVAAHRLVRVKEILRDHLPLSRSRFYQLIALGALPRGTPIGEGARAWRLGDIQAYLRRVGETEGSGQGFTQRLAPKAAPSRERVTAK